MMYFGKPAGLKGSGNIDLGLAGIVAAIRTRTAVADISLLATPEAVISVLTEKDVIALLPVEAIVSTTTDDAIVAITSAQVIATGRPKDEVVGVGPTPVACDDDDISQVETATFGGFQVVGGYGKAVIIQTRGRNAVSGGEG